MESKKHFALLFANTFSHEEEDGGKEELHLDLARFPQPVCIREVRIIPAGSRFHPQLPDRYGRTKPKSFKLEIFVRNLRQPDVSVFEHLAIMEYSESNFLYIPKQKIVTDMFIVKGWYNSLTICLYGNVIGRESQPTSPPVDKAASCDPAFARGSHGAASTVRSEHHGARPDSHHHHQPARPEVRTNHPVPRQEPTVARPEHSGSSRREHTITQAERQAIRPLLEHPPPPRVARSDSATRHERSASASSIITLPESSGSKASEGIRRGDSISSTPLSCQVSALVPGSRTTVKDEPRSDASRDLKVVVNVRAPDKLVSLTRTIVNKKEDTSVAPSVLSEDSASVEEDMVDEDGDSLPFDEMGDDYIGLDGGHQLDMDLFADDEAWMALPQVGFNPYEEIDLMPLSALAPCHRTPHEKVALQCQSSKPLELPDGAQQLCGLLDKIQATSDPYQWLLLLEKIPSLCESNLAYVFCQRSSQSVLSCLTDTTVRAIDWTSASSLPLAVNIRQLKAGIRLFVTLIECGGEVADHLLAADVLEMLCKLLVVEGLASSIKILVLRAIDVALDFPSGMEHFLGWSSSGGRSIDTCYQSLVTFMLLNQTVRVMQCCKVLLTKVHCYELLARLQAQVDAVAASACPMKIPLDGAMEWQDAGVPGGCGTRPTQDAVGPSGQLMSASQGEDAAPSDLSNSMTSVPGSPVKGLMGASTSADAAEQELDEDTAELVLNEEMALQLANSAVASLRKLVDILKSADEALVQLPPKVCPTKCKLVDFTPRSPWPGFLRWCNSRRLLDILLVMMSSPQLSSYPQIFALVRDVLLSLVNTEPGILYLAENYTTSNEIIRVLSQASDSDTHVSRLLSLQDVLHNHDSCTPQNLSMILLYHLQSLKAIDVLVDKAPRSAGDFDTPDVLSSLHLLYTIMFTSIGKYACTYVLAQGSNIQSLLPFALPSGEKEWLNKLKSSVASSYVKNLLLSFLQMSDSVKFLIDSGDKFLAIAEAAGSQQEELKAWLGPVKCLQDKEGDPISALVTLVQSSVNELSSTNLDILPSVVTALRLLKHLCCPPEESSLAVKEELCWKAASLSLLSANAVDVFLSAAQKLCSIQEPLWLQGHLLAHPSFSQFLSMACTLLSVLLELVRQLGTTETVQFCDTRLVTAVVKLHSVMCCAQSSMLCPATQQVQIKVVQILATFTKLPPASAAGPDSAEKQPWYMMLDAVLSFLEKSPQNFIGGLVLISELLPLPLPVLGANKSTVEEVLAHRQLWSAQLAMHTTRLCNLILRLSDTSCAALAQQLRKVCLQLADMDSSMALVVVRPLLEVLVTPSIGSDVASCRALNQLASLLAQPSIKAAALYALRVDDVASSIVTALTVQCLGPVHGNDLGQYAVAVLQALLDPLTLSGTSVVKLSAQQIANSLPTLPISVQILSCLQRHLTSPTASYAVVLSILRTHAMWVQHDPLLAILYSQSESLCVALNVVIERLSKAFCHGSSPTSDEMSTLSTLLELLHMLSDPTAAVQDVDGAQPESLPAATGLEAARLYRLLKWSPAPDQPLRKLAGTLSQGQGQEDNGFGAFLEALQVVIARMDYVKPKQVASLPAELETFENLLPHSQPLGEIFKDCAVLMSDGPDEDNSQLLDLWLQPPLSEDGDSEPDWVEMNLMELVERYCTEWSLLDEIKNCLASTPSEAVASGKRTRVMKRKFDPLISRMRNRSQPVPLRGRGRMLTQKLNRSEMFRLRKQNTSRAPSMHVDDFMILEGDSDPRRPHQSNPPRGAIVGRGMRRGEFPGHFNGGNSGRGRGAMGHPPSFLSGPWAQHSPQNHHQRFQPRMHGRAGDMRQMPMESGPPVPANRIQQELQRILNNLPVTPGASRWSGDGGGMPPAPWQAVTRQSGWSGTGHPGGSQVGHKRHEWMGHGRRMSADAGHAGGMPRTDRPGPLGGRIGPLGARYAGHDSRHQRTLNR